MKAKNYLLVLLLLSFSSIAWAQTKTITGRVTDENGKAVENASVTIKGSKSGVSADANGNFKIQVKTGDVLMVSATNFSKQETKIGNAANYEFSLTRQVNTIDEVIVTGAYNTKRTARSTSYNAQVISSEQLNTIRQADVNNALAGKVAGLQVRSQSAAALDRSTNIRLRGESGLSGGEGAIYVVNGTILPNASDINPDDIEDITVLQGPSAAAQFGPQGSAGAIVITLKKGKKSAGMGVDVNIGGQWEQVYILPNYQNSYAGGNSADLIKYTWKAGDPVEWKALEGKYYPNYSDDASWGPRMVGQEYIPWYAWYGGHDKSFTTANLTPHPENAKAFFNTGQVLNNSIAVSKVSDNMNFRASYGNVDVKGLLPTSYLRKNTLNVNTTIDLNKHFQVGANINYVSQIVRGEINDAYSSQSTGSFNQWFHRDLDMNIMKELKDLKTPDGIYASWNHNDPNTFDAGNTRNFYAGNYWYNFYTWFDLATTLNQRDRLYGDLSLTYKATKDLSIKATYRKQQVTGVFEEKFSSDLALSGTQTTGNEARAKGYYATATSYQNRRNLEFLATYSKAIKDFKINLNMGSDFYRFNLKGNNANTVDGLNVPNLYTIGNSKSQPNVGNGRSEEKYRALFARGDVGFRNYAFLDFSLRDDWFSTLPANNNSILSKSIGGSFVFSDLIKIPAMTYGKIRASWGEIPQALGVRPTEFGAYRYPGFNYGVSPYQWSGNFLMSTPDQLVDSAISGAVKTQREIGMELRFFKNRVGLQVTYWDGTEKNFPFAVTTNGTSGFTSKLLNTGKITKKGIDVQLSLRPISMQNLRWDINATWGRLLENKIVSIAPSVNRITIQTVYGTGVPYLVHAEGQDWGQMYGNGIKRINGQPVIDNGGLYVNDPNVYYGSVLPKYTGGVQNTFNFLKNFTANVNIDYQVGGKFFSLSDMWGSYSGLTARTAVLNDRGVPIRTSVSSGGGVHVAGVDTDGKPKDVYVEAQDYFHGLYDRKAMDFFIYDLTFVKLREVSLGYNIPLERIGLNKWINKVNFSLVARNPILIYAKTKDFDPSEISSIAGETAEFPGTRSIGFNLKVSF